MRIAIGRKNSTTLAAKPAGPRAIRFNSQRCFVISERIWEWAIATLPLDVVVFLAHPHSDFGIAGTLEGPAVILLLAAVAGTFRDQLLGLVTRLRLTRKKLNDRRMFYLLIAGGVLGVAEVFGRLLAHPKGIPFLFALGIGAVAVINGLRSAKTLSSYNKKFMGDRLAQVEQANILNLAAVAIPIICARAFSFVAALNADTLGSNLLGIAGAAVLILALRPAQSNFMAPCPRCRQINSRALIADGFCTFCSPEKFLVKSGDQAETPARETN